MNEALLLQLERDPAGADLLEASWEELDLDMLAIRDGDRLARKLGRVDTIREALRLPLSRRDAENLADCVRALRLDYDLDDDDDDDDDDAYDYDAYDYDERHRLAHEPRQESPEAPPIDGAALRPGMDRDALERWAADHEVMDVIADGIGALVQPEVLYATHTWQFDQRVRDVICAGPSSRGRWDGPSPRLQEAVIAALVDVASRTRAWVADEAAARRWRDVPPRHAVLARLWEELRGLRSAARSTIPPRGWNRAVMLALEHDPPAIVASMEWTRPAEARLTLDPVGMPVLDNRVARLAFTDRVLDLLTSPEDAAARAELERILDTPRWRRDLDALVGAVARPATAPDESKNLLCWRLTEDRGGLGLEPARASRTKRGSLQTRAATLDEVADLLVDPIDVRVAELLASTERGARLEAFEALVGHPRVLAPGRGQGATVLVRRGRLALVVGRDGDDATVQLALDGVAVPAASVRAAVDRDASVSRVVFHRPDAVVVAPASRAALVRLAGWLERGARTPPEGHDALLDVVAGLSAGVPVDVAPALRGARLEGDPRPLLLLSWEEPAALSLVARVRPVPELPPEVPGAGSATAFVRRGARRLCVERDLDAEPVRVRDALAPLGLLERHSQGPFAWRLADVGEALTLVEHVQEHLGAFQVEWAGEVPRVGAPITARDLRLTVSQGRDWFGIGGAVRLESGAVDLAALLRTLEDGHDYVRVGASTFARVDRALKAELGLLAGGDGRISPLLAPAVGALEAAGAEVEAPIAWRDLLGRLEEARTLEAPVPSGLRAELRDYQVVGFRWLAALAHWAPGACLADDMGLGKTVQSIALLLRRAELGPALVVAPASVLFNWERELARFAPDLEVRVHHGSERDLGSPGPGTVLLTSYGVLLRDADALAGIRFATALVDEAQAIKNPSARRSAAAFRLQADFRLALSGTPVENRVAELWSLFRFVAPGLLGSESAFRERFVEPIEGSLDRGRRAILAATIRPFVLRRTKEQVERELPPLTESVLRVALSPEERTLYDAARVRAVARLQQAPARERRFKVLQELLLLRQLACHPRLADPGSEVASSKLRHLRRLLADLRASGHRALVFSQFVKHLALVREALDADGVRYRYLDGTMALGARRAEVDAFQSGDGDAFLVSREAGGVGLNLTAADYVIHLDPGWNPAKEDQATDRAHRIGQDKPVTVYRLVTEGTIEDRILELHAEKRELADALLEGTDAGARASTAELLALLGADDELPPEGPRRVTGVLRREDAEGR